MGIFEMGWEKPSPIQVHSDESPLPVRVAGSDQSLNNNNPPPRDFDWII